MNTFLADLAANRALLTAVAAWAIAQILKVFTSFAVTRKFNWRQISASGGMPSSHTALMTGLAYSIYEIFGLASAEFAISFCVLCVTMYDAAGVRREAGRHASIINLLVEQWEKANGEITDATLKEIIGHTPFEVFGGLIVGILTGILI